MPPDRKRIEITFQTLLDSVHLAEEMSRCVAASLGFNDDDRHRISLAVREGMANAVYYGNEQRPEKLIRLIFEVDAERFVVHILDQGGGFSLSRRSRSAGRGKPAEDFRPRHLSDEGGHGHARSPAFERRRSGTGNGQAPPALRE